MISKSVSTVRCTSKLGDDNGTCFNYLSNFTCTFWSGSGVKMLNHAWCTLCVYATTHKSQYSCGKRSPSITANGKCKPKQVFSSLVGFSEQPPVATTQKHISSGQALDLNKEGRKGQNGGRTFSYIYIWPRFYGPMSSELRFGTSILHTSIHYVPAITNGGIFESLSISEYQRIKGPFPIGRSTAEIKLLQEQQQQWTIKEIGQ